MRQHGKLTKWNDDRGFGFISTSQSNKEIFVHISAFSGDGSRPQLNELVSFEIETGRDGRLQAVRVMRPGEQAAPHRTQVARRTRRPVRASSVLFALLAVVGVGSYIYRRLDSSAPPPQIAPATFPVNNTTATPRMAGKSKRAPTTSASPVSVTNFKCDGRTKCSQMTSCDEAKYFLHNCPNTQMDGDNDGEPCEQQWCN